MKLNIAKCHSVRVTRHAPDKKIQFVYSLHQQILEQVQSAKYLGITITDDLDWGQPISEISSKATKTMGFLWHNLAFAPRHTKEVAYKTLVRPQFEYAAPIWHSYNETHIGQVEKVQRTAVCGPAGDGETPVASATYWTNLRSHPWRPAGSIPP